MTLRSHLVPVTLQRPRASRKVTCDNLATNDHGQRKSDDDRMTAPIAAYGSSCNARRDQRVGSHAAVREAYPLVRGGRRRLSEMPASTGAFVSRPIERSGNATGKLLGAFPLHPMQSYSACARARAAALPIQGGQSRMECRTALMRTSTGEDRAAAPVGFCNRSLAFRTPFGLRGAMRHEASEPDRHPLLPPPGGACLRGSGRWRARPPTVFPGATRGRRRPEARARRTG